MRRPLTQDERRALQVPGSTFGNRPMLAPDDSPVELLACPSAGRNGLVYVQDTIHDGDGFEPDEARRLAVALIQLADHAEYGPGEWHNGEWRPER